MNFKNVTSITALILAVVALGISLKVRKTVKQNVSYELNITCDEDTLTIQNVEKFVKRCKFEHPEVVVAQVILESGNLKSSVAKNNNNLVGMRLAAQRPTTAIGKKDGYAIYTSWKECLMDYLIWQCRYAKGLTQDEYFGKLQSVYASDKVYVEKLKQIINGRI